MRFGFYGNRYNRNKGMNETSAKMSLVIISQQEYL